MQLQIRTDHTIQAHEALIAQFSAIVEGALDRFGDRIVRVDVHLNDENGSKTGQDDKRCMIEAGLEGHPLLVVTDHASKLEQAVEGAADKMSRLIQHTLGRLDDQGSHDEGRDQPGRA